MASIKKKSSGGGGANWMDTYGDMVTLLLCFFVLLYSISTIDAEKWLIVVRSFNRDAMVNEEQNPPGPVDSSQNQTGGDGMPALSEVEEQINELYKFLKNIETAQGDGSVKVSKGTGYVFITFDEAVFFRGDSAVILPSGREMLDSIVPGLEDASQAIDELRVLGHTAQAGSGPNNPETDRVLSGSRAGVVCAYLQERVSLNPRKMVSEGFGQWRNIASNDTPEGKARNRRVEIIVTGKNLENQLGSEFEQYKTMLESTGSTLVSE